MKLGVMQPYIFPYIGYYQLVNAVDRFVLYDDVTFIKQGWINRNRILLNGEAHIFTVPIAHASSFTTIAQTGINRKLYPGWCNKFFKTLAQAYAKAPYYKNAMDVITHVMNTPADTIAQLAGNSVMETSRYIGITTSFVATATGYGNRELKAEARVIDICHKEHATIYINATGGRELYDKGHFSDAGLELQFIKTRNISYPHFNDTFVPWLSAIDLLMFNTPETIKHLLTECDME